MPYCMASLIAASENEMNRMDRLQNNAQRLIRDSVKTTPIDVLLLYTDVLCM